MIGRPPVPPIIRFGQKYVVDADTGCWLWTAALDRNGYGKFGRSPQTGWWRAHKWRWEHDNGPVPDGMVLDHFVCSTPRCVNPQHVRPVTSRENTLRSDTAPAAINAAKTHCIRGHELAGANLYVDPKYGFRQCRTCRDGHPPRERLPKPSKDCAWCGRTFTPKEQRIACCSVSCAQRRRYAAPTPACPVCGSPVRARRRTYCSRSCSNRGRYIRTAA